MGSEHRVIEEASTGSSRGDSEKLADPARGTGPSYRLAVSGG